ncbi:MAG: LysM peptidoglycan-binding domain-containing protein [Planctomycetota bacterium]|nr:LysM peptidoglycan-binding domain-containing protein [Planctomycetota bacterium]
MTAGSRIVIALIVLAFMCTGFYYLVVSGEDAQSPSIAPAVSEPGPAAEPSTPAPVVSQAPAPREPVATQTVAFRVTVPASAPGGIDLDQERRTLSVSGPLTLPGAAAGWYPIADPQLVASSEEERAALKADPIGYLQDRFGLVAATHEEALYVMLFSNAGQSLAPARRRGVDILSADLSAPEHGAPAVELTLGTDTRERLKMLVNRNAARTWAVLVDSVVVEFTRLDPSDLTRISLGGGGSTAELARLRGAIVGSAELAPARFVSAVAPTTPIKAVEQPLLATTPVVVPQAPSRPARPSSDTGTTYRVASGDTLSSIAKQWFGAESDWPRIVAANPGLEPDRLRIGQELTLPARTAAPPTTGRRGSEPASGGVVAARPSPGTRYQVRSGDSLSRIAQEAYGSARYWDLIYQANRSLIGSDPADLSLDMVLVIPKAPR